MPVTRQILDDQLNRQTVEVEVFSQGLIIHKMWPAGPGWAVTALPCGMRIAWARSYQGARRLAAEIEKLPIKWYKVTAHDKESMLWVVGILKNRLTREQRLWLIKVSTEGAD